MVTWTRRKIGIKTEEEELKCQLGEDVLFRQWMWIFKGPQQTGQTSPERLLKTNSDNDVIYLKPQPCLFSL